MKHINKYIDEKIIDEGLLSWLKAFIKKTKSNQDKLVVNGKVTMLDMDEENVKIQKEPAKLYDLIKDKNTLSIWDNNKTGFPATSAIAKNPKKYCIDLGETVSDPYVYTFYYQGDNTYHAGVMIYDNAVSYINDYVHIISIETNLVVDNPSDVERFMLNGFKEMITKKKKNVLGFTAKADVHPKMKGILNNLRFVQSEDNDEIYKYDL